MSLFAISDLHLSFKSDKPMDVFGDSWKNYVERLRDNWLKTVGEEDFVIMCGDNSWETYLDDLHLDFEFINNLPGKKILSKGNHDYWWTTKKKMDDFCRQNGFYKINFLQNNYYIYGDVAICGTRGWLAPGTAEDKKIYEREMQRLVLSLDAAKKSNPKQIIAALHYPPDEGFRRVLKDHGVTKCVFGHLHGKAHQNAINGTIDGIKYMLVSCDFLQFNPLKLL